MHPAPPSPVDDQIGDKLGSACRLRPELAPCEHATNKTLLSPPWGSQFALEELDCILSPTTPTASMPWVRRALKHGPVRASARSAVSTSASLPHSNIASAEASLAASAAVAELTAGLDFVFDRFGDEDNPGDQLQYHLERLSEEAERYPASSLHDGVGKEWSWYALALSALPPEY